MRREKRVRLSEFVVAVLVVLATRYSDGAVTLNNPGFTNGTGWDADDWTENSLDEAARQSWGSHDGDGWLMSLPGYGSGTYGEFYQDIAGITPGCIYSLSFWQGGDAVWNGSNVTARLIWLDDASSIIGGVTSNLDAYTSGSVSWTNITIDSVAPKQAAVLRVRFDAESPTGGSGAAKFDDLVLTELPGLRNPGFADGGVDARDADSWTENSLDEAARQSWGSHDGDGWLISLVAWNTGTYCEVHQDVPAIAGHFYTLSFWQEGDVAWNGSNVAAHLIWFDGASNNIGETAKNLDSYTGGAVSWTNLTMRSVAPPDAVRLRVQFDGESLNGGSGAAKFDDLSLSNAAPAGTVMILR